MVRISPEIYSGGAVLFDTRSLFDYQQKIADRIAKKQAAEQEAIDNYLKELAKTPDPYGIRTNDYDVYKKKLEDYRALYNDYKKSPRDATKRFKLEQAADGLKIFVARSKEEKEKDKSYINLIASLATDPEKRKTTDFDRLIADKTNQDLPLDFKGVAALGIPARKDKDFNPNYYTPKFDFQATFDNAAKGPGITTSELSVTPSKTRGYNVIQKGFGVSAIKSIASNFGNDVESDDDKKSYYKTKFKNTTPEKLTEQNIRLKKYFPKMEVDADNPVSLAMAEAIEEAERRTSSDLVAVSRGTTVNVGGSGGAGSAGQIDLTTYRDVGDSKDVTDIFQGVKVTGLPKGESMVAKQVLYNKQKNQITVTEWVGRDASGNLTGEKTRTIPYNVFLQNIKTLNPQVDFKYIETLPNAKTGKAPSTLTMKASEYRKLSVAERKEFLSKGGVVN